MAKFREFVLSSGREIFLGKSAESNDELVADAKRDDVLLHTSAPGSPFCKIEAGAEISKDEIKEAAVYCAKFSQDWRDNKKDISVHKFLKANVKKDKKMKTGTWQVSKIDERIKVKKADILKLERTLEDARD